VIARQYIVAAALQLWYIKSFGKSLSGSLPGGRDVSQPWVQTAVLRNFDQSWGVVGRSTVLIVARMRNRILSRITAASLLILSSSW
jgi:hypothetical protein